MTQEYVVAAIHVKTALIHPQSAPNRGRSRRDLTVKPVEALGMPSGTSTPVQIPPSRRPAPSILVSHPNHPFAFTPDPVFDMSPVTSEFGSSPSSSNQPGSRGSDKFLYTFPSLPPRPIPGPSGGAHPCGKDTPSPPDTSAQVEDRIAEVASRYRLDEPLPFAQASRSPYLRKGSNVLDEYELSPGGMSPDFFCPMKDNYHPTDPHTLHFQRQLRSKTSLGPATTRRRSISPGPRQPPGETSPWVFAARGTRDDRGTAKASKKGSQEDVASSGSYSHIDPGVYEYKNHLMKRLESRYPSRLNVGAI